MNLAETHNFKGDKVIQYIKKRLICIWFDWPPSQEQDIDILNDFIVSIANNLFSDNFCFHPYFKSHFHLLLNHTMYMYCRCKNIEIYPTCKGLNSLKVGVVWTHQGLIIWPSPICTHLSSIKYVWLNTCIIHVYLSWTCFMFTLVAWLPSFNQPISASKQHIFKMYMNSSLKSHKRWEKMKEFN